MQDVVEISQECMRDIQGGGTGVSCVDFRIPAGTRAGSKQVGVHFHASQALESLHGLSWSLRYCCNAGMIPCWV